MDKFLSNKISKDSYTTKYNFSFDSKYLIYMYIFIFNIYKVFLYLNIIYDVCCIAFIIFIVLNISFSGINIDFEIYFTNVSICKMIFHNHNINIVNIMNYKVIFWTCIVFQYQYLTCQSVFINNIYDGKI